ncbi:MAG: 3'-5' exonuclease [Saprospiraceae bacterium]|nr:3'-5' exonuclease [Saprospiraceae bacterium]
MKLKKPIVFFDLETTGIDIVKDRIVQIGAIKIEPNGEETIKNVLINPTIPIPEGATAVHGITDDDVKDKPMFRQIAKSMLEWLEGCDLAGYNSDNFDIPLLAEEFGRLGFDYPYEDTVYIDIIRIERMINSHKLGDTYKRYTGQTLEDAHDALADVKATMAIFEKQVEENENLQTSISDIALLYTNENKRVDFARKIFENDGKYYWNFGKHRNQLISETQDYAEWVLNSDFAYDTKKHIRRILGNL